MDDPYTPPVKSPDGVLFRRPWELVSETLMQYRLEQQDDANQWVPPVMPNQRQDPLAGAYPPIMETKRVPNFKSLNAAFDSGPRAGRGDLQPHTGNDYMVPPKFGWRTEELGIVDIMDGVFTKISDPQNPANSGYIDDFSGGKAGYVGSLDHNSMTIPQGL